MLWFPSLYRQMSAEEDIMNGSVPVVVGEPLKLDPEMLAEPSMECIDESEEIPVPEGTKKDDEEEIDVVGLSDGDSNSRNKTQTPDEQKPDIEEADEDGQQSKKEKKTRSDRPKSRSVSPIPDFKPSADDPYDYDADEHYFDNKEMPLPFENMSEFETCFTMMPAGEKRFVLDHMMHAANVMFGEYRRLNGQLRALNARSGRINKQVQREAEVVACGSDPRLAPRSSKNLNTSVVEAVMELDEHDAERILSKKKLTPTMRALLRSQKDDIKPGKTFSVLDHMMHAANVMFGEYRRLNGQLRALNARSGRINKQVQREAEVVACGSDPRLAPRSSKNLNTSVVEAVMELDEHDAERILSKKKLTP
uniref:Uncharacterized protein n=1 Tax=Panagrolaimus sp. JU765 TaxID=591449 RepID=A0AC34RB98_9BILA